MGDGFYTISEVSGGQSGEVSMPCSYASAGCGGGCDKNWLFICLLDWSAGTDKSYVSWAYKTAHSVYNVRKNYSLPGETRALNSVCVHSMEYVRIICAIRFDGSSIKTYDRV